MPAWTPFQRLGATANWAVSRGATFKRVRIKKSPIRSSGLTRGVFLSTLVASGVKFPEVLLVIIIIIIIIVQRRNLFLSVTHS